MGRARAWHVLVFLVAAFAIGLQLVLVWQGHRVLDEASRPDLATRLVRFVSYFTILCNVLVAITSLALAMGSARGRVFRALRMDAIVGIAVTGIVHWFFLRPLLDLHGADYLADKLLHVVVPVLAIVVWLLVGPRGVARRSDLVAFLVVPLAWLAYTLVRGAVVDWYPYPFLDVDQHGYAVVLFNCVGVSAIMLLLFWGCLWLDPKLPGQRTRSGRRSRW